MESKLKRTVNRFFSRRNGLDELALLSIIIALIFTILSIVFPEIYYFYAVAVVFGLYGFFRIFSKNIYARENENTAFCNLFKRKNKVRKQKTINVKEKKVKEKKVKIKKDKNFIYKNCPNCNNELKISKGKKGERIIMCGKCYTEIKFKI